MNELRTSVLASVTAALLAACGASKGQLGMAPSAVSGQQYHFVSAATKLTGEILVATQGGSKCLGNSGVYSGDFRSQGNATGPLSGTFSAHGKFSAAGGVPKLIFFREHFTIRYGTHTFLGRILLGHHPKVKFSCFPLKLVASNLRYWGEGITGPASVTITTPNGQTKLKETFH
jgi:hypothetical protein